MDGEIWKNVVGFEGYAVSSFGRLKSLSKVVSRPSSSFINKRTILSPRKERIMKTPLNRGYPCCGLRKNGKTHPRSVHRLVAMAFIENTYDKPQVNHKDGIRHNNNIDNLEWVSAMENNVHAIVVLNRKCGWGGFGTDNKKKVIQSDLNGSVIKVWDSLTDAVNETHISIHFIRKAIIGEKPHGCFLWSYDKTNEEYQKIRQEDLNGNIIKVWDGFQEIKRSGFSITKIKKVCDKDYTAFGFVWRLEKIITRIAI